MAYIKYCLALIFSLLIFAEISFPCTTFCIHTDNELVFCKNYDWMVGCGLVIVNKRDVKKIAFVQNEIPARWVSRYGSVTFNQFGREFPSGGINEAGLVVEILWLEGTEFPEADERPAVGGTLQWIQYQLDNFSSVDDIIESDKVIRIPSNSVPVHFFAADKTGKCVSVEFLGGKAVFHTGDNMMMKVLTNDSYQKSIDYLKQHKGFGGEKTIETDKSSLGRFVNACSLVKNYIPSPGKTAVDYGFEILGSASQGEFTKWSIVYDIKNMIVYFRTYDNQKIKSIDLKSNDFKCGTEVKVIDINIDSEGDIDDLMSNYSYELNRELIEESYSVVDFLKKVSRKSRDRIAAYPEILQCSGNPQINEGSVSAYFSRLPFIIAAGLLILSVLVILKFKHRRKL
jgi:penicillin V acylase-like amidase (Ntn superfamily)